MHKQWKPSDTKFVKFTPLTNDLKIAKLFKSVAIRWQTVPRFNNSLGKEMFTSLLK